MFEVSRHVPLRSVRCTEMECDLMNPIEVQTPSRRMLVVDDDAQLRELMSDVACAAGYEVTQYENFADIEQKDIHFYDVIVLDMLMPGIDGIEVIRSLAEQNSEARLILVSGLDRRTLETARSLAHSKGLTVHGVLNKPFRINVLDEMLRAIPERQAAQAPHAAKVPKANKVSLDELSVALEQQQILCHYQPQITLKDNAWYGIEALVRWAHPRDGLLYPDAFISFVENSALATPFTLFVLRKAVDDCRKLEKECGFSGQLAINVPTRALSDVRFADQVVGILTEKEFPPDRLTIEITETSIVESQTTLLDILVRLRMRGIQLSIDDFGTGHSSLERLRGSPFNELKIDMVFVRDTERDTTSHAIVDSSIQLGHRLDMVVLAEGVETEAMRDRLVQQGCDVIQGYLVSRPIPVDEMYKVHKSFTD